MIFPKGKDSAIGICQNAITDSDCDFIVDSFEKLSAHHFTGRTVSGIDESIKKTTDLHIITGGDLSNYTKDQIHLMDSVDKIIFSGVYKAVGEYIHTFETELKDWFEPFDTGYQLQKYTKGEGKYTEHCDGGAFAAYPLYQRVLGLVVYLNTVTDGGGTKFPLQNYTVKPIKGNISVFPANFTHPHIAEVPVSNDKYIASTFMMSYVLDVDRNRVIMDETGHELRYY